MVITLQDDTPEAQCVKGPEPGHRGCQSRGPEALSQLPVGTVTTARAVLNPGSHFLTQVQVPGEGAPGAGGDWSLSQVR